ncbi:2-succinyl-5-enolpyruvyl-6-hydroxy-3-cyclohexene-1-carboxylic-acid synthase [Nesterenkonia xinjiangensis]|uniref:2-succinyl-5-enolpyruvyl-6-hydroxy-3-cyclohexene-1-carboxylate synthase n=1 Tax=Nesterenkonia xinjiangensis TaxID=225327 RepID=A0A7Z0GLS3_9MICC|nr:2-succinyl-5-enolpyruvyl-6-hydroxy-3-cyclohexene-1-carboxylic-acid synthase [Nesterenkonia xinjiangensis]NYJ77491.1 2-succinyl-5-enolpyruvyl-6-hydroxy-3-cyclohexene-1-carboxylate synthase [Nesterenkonia xinjiangensis]
MHSSRRPFREFDDSEDAEALRLARRVVRGLSLSMRHVVIAPGSRSAPLAYALAEAEQLGAIRLHVRIDERSAAYTALGIALDSGRPAGVVTTSGTAAGNLMPAMMEADMAGVPLVAITADRPEELHGTGANQTTWQQGMFAARVRDEIHLEQGEVRLEPVSRDDLLSAETQVSLLMRQAAESRGRGPGPVHLNIGFRDPLIPRSPDGGAPPPPQRWARRPVLPDSPARPAEQGRSSTLLDGLDAQEREAAREQIRRSLRAVQDIEPDVRTVFVLGHDAPAEVAQLALELGHPLLAEPTSGSRHADAAVPAYRLLLQAPETSAAGRLTASVQRVVVAGRPTLSRPVQRLLAAEGVDVVQYRPAGVGWHDERLPRPVQADPQRIREFAGAPPQGWLEEWLALGRGAQQVVDRELAEVSAGGLSSVQVAQAVAETVRTPLLLGSSSVIRDVDLSARLGEPGPARLFALRGLSGIDGNVSAASGVSLSRGHRVTALVGDLTFLHDLNALLLPSGEQAPSVDVVVVNDGGGAIFDQLEHGEVGRRPGQADAVERLFGTPQAVDLASLAAGFAVEHRRVETLDELGQALAHPDDRLGLRIIEVRTDRRGLRELHARMKEGVAGL